MFKKISIISAIVLVIIIAAYFGLVREVRPSGHISGSTDGIIYDKDFGITDNFKNGKISITVNVDRGYLEDILNEDNPMVIEMLIVENLGNNFGCWSTPPINIRENSGKTEANYGENIECDGVIYAKGTYISEDWNDNIYIKIFVPTNRLGRVTKYDNILIEMWPTTDPIDMVDNVISPASFDNAAPGNWWDENDRIELLIYGKNSLSLTGPISAYLFGYVIDE